jgi:hypothetical protein
MTRKSTLAARHIPRRDVLMLGFAGAAVAAAPVFAQSAKTPIEVWKDPECGCCKDWVAHLEANGFIVKVNESGNDEMRARLGVPRKYGSCHTALAGGYAIEGHVPAREIRRLLHERPAAIGLAVPGMPIGAPGMDGPAYGGRRHPFDVVLLDKGGAAKVYQRYEANRS